MTLVTHPFVVAIGLGVVYLLVWALYRMSRGREHRLYRRLHGDERRHRATFDQYHEVPMSEQLRRAAWDAQFGPLMGPLDLKNREENRWPVGTALQGATTITMSLLVAALIWTVRGAPVAKPAVPANVPRGAPVEEGGNTRETTTPVPRRYIDIGRDLPSLPLTLSLAVLMMVSGLAVAIAAKSNAVKVVGATIAVTGSLLSGAKLLSIDKILATKDLFTIHYAPSYGDPAAAAQAITPFARRTYLPAFASGSAVPDETMLCAANTLARELAQDPAVLRITIQAGADRQELTERAVRRYGSNWGLAQQRGLAIQKVFERAAILPAKILVLNSGPVYTASYPQAWEFDRRAWILIEGSGDPRAWQNAISKEGAWSACGAPVR